MGQDCSIVEQTFMSSIAATNLCHTFTVGRFSSFIVWLEAAWGISWAHKGKQELEEGILPLVGFFKPIRRLGGGAKGTARLLQLQQPACNRLSSHHCLRHDTSHDDAALHWESKREGGGDLADDRDSERASPLFHPQMSERPTTEVLVLLRSISEERQRRRDG